MKTNRPYRIVTGPAYPLQLKSHDTPENSRVPSEALDQHSYYHHESVRLTRADIQNFRGKPICVEHQEDLDVGVVTDAFEDSKGGMWMTSRVYTDTETGKRVMASVDAGEMVGLSVSYIPHKDSNGRVVRREAREISLCRRGFFDGASVAITASDKAKYKNSDTIFIKIQAMSGENTDKAVGGPVATDDLAKGKQTESEIARAYDKLVAEKEEQARQLKEMQEYKLAMEAKEKQRLEDYASKQLPKLEKILDLYREQAKTERGDDAKLAPEFESSVKDAFLHPEGESSAIQIEASILSWKRNRDSLLEAQAQLKELQKAQEEQLAQRQAEAARIQASRQKATMMDSPSSPAEPVTASDNKVNFNQLFGPAPSDAEKQIFARDYPELGAMFNNNEGIKASALEMPAIKASFQHGYKKHVRNSMSNHFPELYNYAVQNFTPGMPTLPMEHSVERLDV